MIFRLLSDFRPRCILEFGMGETTKILSAYITGLEPSAKVFTVEHNPQWIRFFGSNELNLSGINVIEVLMEKAEISGARTNYYRDLPKKLADVRNVELFIVDGPLGTPRKSRYNLCEVIEADLLADEFVLLLDDANRKGERETIGIAEDLMREKGIQFHSAMIAGAKKDVYAAFTDRYRFLGSV